MKQPLRLIYTAVTLIAVYFFSNIFILNILPFPDSIIFLKPFISFAIAILIAKMIWNKTDQLRDSFATYCLMGGLSVGGVGLLGGFLGPMIFMPESNLGPLLGIFITGPIGFLIGFLGGWIYWEIKKKKS
ncbi:hypothetical protein [Sediminibacterium sp.]|uniref:hypothetical protein n=1 Tax=Sediminibacterium sp. TaxID=1917865 RepID=UPI0027337C82|nr:hypothetical protein [Sediminibacterium sp.]MDP3392654.1 hypothetical protein [Sediminibacterium sp.]MDP3566103.1 hypothetical protein [Sediminibacterium sp.]